MISSAFAFSAHSEKAKAELITWLDGDDYGNGAIWKMRQLLRDPTEVGMWPTMEHKWEVVIYEDEDGKIVGSPQNSGGYVYVCGWLHKHTKEGI